MIVLDSSVVLAALQRERGGADVDALIEAQPCAVPTTCVSEVIMRLMRSGMSLAAARAFYGELELIELPFDEDVRDETATLEGRTRDTGTSFVDRSCIATGIVHDSLVMTADTNWMNLDIPEADIRLVR